MKKKRRKITVFRSLLKKKRKSFRMSQTRTIEAKHKEITLQNLSKPSLSNNTTARNVKSEIKKKIISKINK
jgi:hypothetical protein